MDKVAETKVKYENGANAVAVDGAADRLIESMGGIDNIIEHVIRKARFNENVEKEC